LWRGKKDAVVLIISLPISVCKMGPSVTEMIDLRKKENRMEAKLAWGNRSPGFIIAVQMSHHRYPLAHTDLQTPHSGYVTLCYFNHCQHKNHVTMVLSRD